MLLVELEASKGWLTARWQLTRREGWDHICKAIHFAYEHFEQPVVLTDNDPVAIGNQYDILKLEEKGSLAIRGYCTLLKVHIIIIFANQTNVVYVSVMQENDEFSEADYQKFNISMCQYMDSLELAMYIWS